MTLRTMPRISKHTMLGSGGTFRTPKSESVQLQKAFSLLEDIRFTNLEKEDLKRVRMAMDIIKELSIQVGEGYHRNPAKFRAGTVVGKLGQDVHDIRYKHAEDGKHYEHEFGGEVEVYAVERNGKRDLLLTHRRGESLWDDF